MACNRGTIDLLQLLGREHNAAQAEDSFAFCATAGFENVNVDLMFGLTEQTLAQWEATLEQTIALGPEHISTYCLTYEEDTEFFLRHARGEFKDPIRMRTQIFRNARCGCSRGGLRALRDFELRAAGICLRAQPQLLGGRKLSGHWAERVIPLSEWTMAKLADYRNYADKVLAGISTISSIEELNEETKRREQIALGLARWRRSFSWLEQRPNERDEFVALGLLRSRTEISF